MKITNEDTLEALAMQEYRADLGTVVEAGLVFCRNEQEDIADIVCDPPANAAAPDWKPLEIAFQNASLPTNLVLQFMWMYEDENARHHYKAIDSRRYLIVNRIGQPLVKTEWGMQAVPSIAPLLADVLPPFCLNCGCTRPDVLLLAHQEDRDTGDPICCEVTI